MSEWSRGDDRVPPSDSSPDVAAEEQTQRLGGAGAEGTRHVYGSATGAPGPTPGPAPGPAPGREETTAFGGFGFQPYEPPERQRRSRPGAAVVAGILAAALVVGGAAGLGGAAGYDLLAGSDPTPTRSSSPTAEDSPVASGNNEPAPDPGSVQDVAARVLPSVVKITVRGQQGQGSGSGIILSEDGEILTNNHVVAVGEGGGDISVSFNDGTAAPATVVGTDPLTDLAVIKAEDVSGLQPANVDTNGSVSVGENVVAIGSPFGLEATVTSGIVSATNRPVSVGSADGSGQSAEDTTYPAIQTDAAINPGNSGGPLVDLSGKVVGINSSIRTASSGLASSGGNIGLGFAIPMAKVWPIVEQLRAGDEPTHARIGVSVRDASTNNDLLTGAGVQAVTDGSAAADAGLREGDVITKVDDEIITGSESLVATVRGYRPGDQVTLTVVRNGGDTRTVDVTLDSDAAQ